MKVPRSSFGQNLALPREHVIGRHGVRTVFPSALWVTRARRHNNDTLGYEVHFSGTDQSFSVYTRSGT